MKALLDFWLFEQMPNLQNAGMPELEAQPLVCFAGQAEFLGKAIKGVVHRTLREGQPPGFNRR
jgi:hypothetical protein